MRHVKRIMCILVTCTLLGAVGLVSTSQGKVTPNKVVPGCSVTECWSLCSMFLPPYFRCIGYGRAEHYDDRGNRLPVTIFIDIECQDTKGAGCQTSRSSDGYGTTYTVAECWFHGSWPCNSNISCWCTDY